MRPDLDAVGLHCKALQEGLTTTSQLCNQTKVAITQAST
jgi:hypothetical protein